MAIIDWMAVINGKLITSLKSCVLITKTKAEKREGGNDRMSD